MSSVEVHVEEVVVHGRADGAAIERSIVEHLSRALGDRGLAPDLVASGATEGLRARPHDDSAGAIGSGVARALTGGDAP